MNLAILYEMPLVVRDFDRLGWLVLSEAGDEELEVSARLTLFLRRLGSGAVVVAPSSLGGLSCATTR